MRVMQCACLPCQASPGAPLWTADSARHAPTRGPSWCVQKGKASCLPSRALIPSPAQSITYMQQLPEQADPCLLATAMLLAQAGAAAGTGLRRGAVPR